MALRRIKGVIQHNAWGHSTAIANLRGVAPSGFPEAEYWLGTHKKGSSQVLAESGVESGPNDLGQLIAENRVEMLGDDVAGSFGELPYLLKLLAAARPLSIQVHPNKNEAEAGFSRENQLGIDRLAPNRNYRDTNHKPELICAITSFEAKCGFRRLPETQRLFSAFDDPRIEPLQTRLDLDSVGNNESAETLASVVQWLLRLDSEEASCLVTGLVENSQLLLAESGTVRSDGKPGGADVDNLDVGSVAVDFAAELRWTTTLHEAYPGDPGVAVALLLNHLSLESGQALFLEAGILHSYCEGLAVELMANSDNVIRGGLTPKHVDVDELLKVVSYEPYEPRVQRPESPVHHFDVPVRDFGLARYDMSKSNRQHAQDGDNEYPCTVIGPEILLVTNGEVEVLADGSKLRLAAGDAVFVPYSERSYRLRLNEPDAVLWRATVGSS